MKIGDWRVNSGNIIVGCARRFWDRSYVAYLADVMVKQQYQGQGIGKRLVEECRCGARRTAMAKATISAEFPCEVEKVWELVTSLENYSWRSDLDKIVITAPRKEFEEHTVDGYVTKFTITAFEECKRYEFEMENENMQGYWVGLFSYQNGVTVIEFTENVIAKKWIMKPFVSSYLKKQQIKYVWDLRAALEV